jgi:nitrogenase subunit NifH
MNQYQADKIKVGDIVLRKKQSHQKDELIEFTVNETYLPLIKEFPEDYELTNEQFAKLFQVGQAQVLVTTETNDEDKYKIICKTNIQGSEIIVTAGFHNEQERDMAFDHYNQQSAEDFYKAVLEDFFKENQ